MKQLPISILLTLFCLLSLSSKAQSNNDLLYNQLGQSSNNQYANIFTQMSKNALSESPRKALAYSIAAEYYAKTNKKDKLQALIAQCEALLQLGKYQQTIKIADQALLLNHNNTEPEGKLLCFIGQAAKELGDFDKAQSHYNKALSVYQKSNNTKACAQIYQWQGSLMLRQNNLTEAQNNYTKAFQLYSEKNDSNALAGNLAAEALLNRQKGDLLAALANIDKGFQYAQNQAIETNANLFHLRGSVYFLQRKNAEALVNFEKALALRQKTGNAADIASTLLSISNIYRETNQYKKGIQNLNQALYLRQRLADTTQIVNIYNAIGGFNLRFNFYDKALLNYLRALQLSYHDGYTAELAPLLMNIGTLYYELNDTQRASEYLNKAIDLMRLPRDKSKLSMLYVHLGNNSRKAHFYQLAIDYYKKALVEKKQLNDKLGTSSVLLNIGAAYQEWKNFDQALTYSHKALTLQKEIKNAQGEANALNQLGNIYNDQKKAAEALLYFKLTRQLSSTNNLLYLEALSSRKEAELELQNSKPKKAYPLIIRSIYLGRKLSNAELIRKGQLALHDYYTQLNDYKSALSAYRVYAQFTDSLNKQQNQQQIIQIQLNFEIARRDTRINESDLTIEKLNKEREQRNYQLKIQRYLQYLWIAIIILLLISAGSLIKGYQLKKKAAILLQEKFAISEDSNQKLRKSKEELLTLNHTKDKFFSIIAHDLKNPLGGLVSLTELMNTNYEQLSEPDKREMIKLMSQSSRQLNTLLENLLHWSRVQLGKMPFRPENLNFNEKANECFELQNINASAKNITLLNTSKTTDIVWADTDMLSLVLRNLVSNAIKFTPRGGTVTISTKELTEQLLEITISDTGIGLTDEEKTKLFRLDVNFTTSGTDNEPGTGLGLILCKECIERHGGTIHVESVFNQGCQFIFTLNRTENV